MQSELESLFLRSLYIIAVFALLSASCKDDSVVLICPSGTALSNGICCPPGTLGQEGVCVLDADSGVQFAKEDVQSAQTQDAGEQVPDILSSADVAPDVFDTTGEIGARCENNEHCLDDSICLSWPDGYCTLIGCTASSCPEGSQCASTGSATVCMRSCENTSDCREEGYACKNVEASNGSKTSVCHGVNEDAGNIGDTCATNSDCKGSATCYSGVTGGMCVEESCSVGSCGEGTLCVMLDGAPRCLKKCNFAADCQVEGFERTCESLPTPPGDSVNVCFVPQGSEPIGAPCAGGYACESSLCRIVAKGLCSFDSEQSCASDFDCPDGQQCLVSTQSYQGVCSQPCDATGCPGSAACLADEKGEGWCYANCSGPTDPNCNELVGTQCLFGSAEGSSLSKFYCAKAQHPGPMTSCLLDETCGTGGICLLPGTSAQDGENNDVSSSSEDAAGYCLTPCASSGACAFPGQCLPYGEGGNYFCMRPCNTAEQCPANMACPMVQGNNRACLPVAE